MFYLYVEDRRTAIHTKISFGSSEDIRHQLMKKIKIQLQLEKDEVERFIDCPMSFEEYEQVLRRKGIAI